MFTNYARPFYAQATPLELKAIAIDKFYKFAKTNQAISKEAFEILYEMVDDESWLIQNLCYHL
jgi:hypothetical protein